MIYSKRILTISLTLLLALAILDLPITLAQNPQDLPPPPPPPPKEKPNRGNRGSNIDIEQEDTTIKIDSELVVLDVSILDKNNKFITGIQQNKFQVYEDQIAQKIEFFSQEEVPISYGIVIDTSGSMRKRLPTVIKAAKTLIALSRPGDEVFIVDMKDTSNIELLEDFTTSMEDANDALDNMVSGGGTALLDGVVVSSEYAKGGKHRRKALLVISDGDERDSTFTVDQTLDKLREFDVQLYMIGFPDEVAEDSGLFKRSPRKKAIELINKLTTESGGQAYFPRDLADLEPIAKKIGADLRSQYSIGYYPSNGKQDGTFRKLKVVLNENKDYAVRTRSGYFAPKEGGNRKEDNSLSPKRLGK
ncbi:MAG: VWA domain-containing protein [Acidobacteria bacterium]|nr:VWA domain-containing protein [Acidobacteriota bacterium]